MKRYKHDVFISHASEDKADFVEPLAKELRKFGLKVWFDKFSLKVGDSLRESIETGLANSRYGVVIFSPNFLSKNWPQAELNGLFSIQMSGRKVILPVWHNITSAEMNAKFPIQADMVALRSSSGIEVVAKALIAKIRPKLLKAEVQKDMAFDAASCFMKTAKSQHPGYGFSVLSGALDSPVKSGTLATVTRGANRIDISISDPTLIREQPKLNITFVGDGAKKIAEFYRTGKAQSWDAGEFVNVKGNLPLMPTTFGANYKLVLKSNVDDLPARCVRLEIGVPAGIAFPLLQMKLARAGADEAEAIIQHKDTPLKLGFIFSPNGSVEPEINLSWAFMGHTYSQCKKTIETIDRLREGDVIRILDIEEKMPPLELPTIAEMFKDDPFPSSFRAMVFLAAQVEQRFGINLKHCSDLSDEDAESLIYLDRLLNGKQYGTNMSVTFTIQKSEESEVAAAQKIMLEGEPMGLFQEATDYPGFFPLLGQQISTPIWGLYTEKCVASEVSPDISAFDQAKAGSEFIIKFVAQSPTFVWWKTDYQKMAGIPLS